MVIRTDATHRHRPSPEKAGCVGTLLRLMDLYVAPVLADGARERQRLVVGLRSSEKTEAKVSPVELRGRTVEQADGREWIRILSAERHASTRAHIVPRGRCLIDSRAAIAVRLPARGIGVGAARARVEHEGERRAAHIVALQSQVGCGLRDASLRAVARRHQQIAHAHAPANAGTARPAHVAGRCAPRICGSNRRRTAVT